jgi:hypothetical protein
MNQADATEQRNAEEPAMPLRTGAVASGFPCPQCSTPAIAVGKVELRFVLVDNVSEAVQCRCKSCAIDFLSVGTSRAELPHRAGSDLDQDSWVLTCQQCHNRAKIIGKVPVSASDGSPFGGLRIACKTCRASYVVADLTAPWIPSKSANQNTSNKGPNAN